MKAKNIFKTVVLFLSLTISVAGYAQSKTSDRENKSNEREQIEYLTETYYFTENPFTEYGLRSQIESLPGVVAVQVNNGSSTVVVKFDKKRNSVKKLKKSFKKIGLSGNFEENSKTRNKSGKDRKSKDNNSEQ